MTIGGIRISTTSFAASPNCNSGNCLNQPSNNINSTSGTLATATAVACGNLVNFAGTRRWFGKFLRVGEKHQHPDHQQLKDHFRFRHQRCRVGQHTVPNNIYSVDYDYPNFANPTFSSSSSVNSRSLDFGSLLINGGLATLNFSITRIGKINATGLSLTSTSRLINDCQFGSTITTFTKGLDGGLTNSYALNFNPLSVGTVNDIFTFNFINFAPTGSVGARRCQLTASGILFVPVPEPPSRMMMPLGFGLVGAFVCSCAAGQPS